MVAITSKITNLNPKTLGIILICGVSFLWGFLEVLVQHIPGRYSIYQIVWFRYATHLLFMLLVFSPRQGIKLIKTKQLGLQLSRSVMMLIMPVSYVMATKYMSARDILAVFWLLPVMIIILAIFLLRERVSWFYWVSAIAGSIVLALLLHPNLHVTALGLLLAFLMGL
ncbi:MAG TPA: EamA family transporter, partial [Anaerolineales bacterium]|nr:EamA family transporter [Anaerolineales bacterium]